MTKSYILVDDEVGSFAPAETYAEAIMAASEGAISIATHKPASLRDVLEHIATSKPDGVFLDVALTNALDATGNSLAFDGIALAQQIRTLQTRGLSQGVNGLPEFPLIRFSKRDVIREYVSGDSTSEDLFDEKIEKEQVLADAGAAARRAASLAADYPRLTAYARSGPTEATLATLLAVPTDLLPRLEPRAWLGLLRGDAPTHVLSRYMTGVVLARPNPLVDEPLLAVRLGVDVGRSGDWPKLIEALYAAAYKGVFGSGYSRWWMVPVLDWWQQTIDAATPPFKANAVRRVEALRSATGFEGLEPIEPNDLSPGTTFWHLCVRSGLPVDPSQGSPLMPAWGQEGWQDTDYLCLEEAKRDRRNPRLRPSERARLKDLVEKDKKA